MDAVISGSASVTRSLPLPPVGARTVSCSVGLSNSWWGRHRERDRVSSHRTRTRGNWCAVPQLTVTCGASVTEINESQFKETVLKSNRPVLVEFVATWCGPCRLIAPAVESLAQVCFRKIFLCLMGTTKLDTRLK